MHLVAALRDVMIELNPSSHCRIFGVHDAGAEVFDPNLWPIVENLILKSVLGIYANPML